VSISPAKILTDDVSIQGRPAAQKSPPGKPGAPIIIDKDGFFAVHLGRRYYQNV
jgi:hypothetical protein